MHYDIQVLTESQTSQGWAFEVRIFCGGKTYNYQTSLSWQDYDLWSKGRARPEHVVRGAFKFLLSREEASEIMPRFDCSIIRRFFGDVDDCLPELIG